jgi:hypothetical protein
MKTIKSETQIKNIIQSIITEHGIKDLDTTTPTSHIFMVAPNRWSYGYIVLSHEGQIWSADFNKNGGIRTPKPTNEFYLSNRGHFTPQGWH